MKLDKDKIQQNFREYDAEEDEVIYHFGHVYSTQLIHATFKFNGKEKPQAIRFFCGCQSGMIIKPNLIECVIDLTSLFIDEQEKLLPERAVDKTVQIYFDDGEDFFLIDENGILHDNPEKTFIYAKVRGKILNPYLNR